MVIEHHAQASSYNRLLPNQKNIYASVSTVVIRPSGRDVSPQPRAAPTASSLRMEDLRLGSDCEATSSASSDDDPALLSPEEQARVELSFKSHKTYVFVCRCLANLYFAGADRGEWRLSHTGVPVVLLDRGDTRQRTKRRLQLALAERATGLALWIDVLDNLSDYRAQDLFHTFLLSYDHSKKAGLSFDSERAAHEFAREVSRLTSDPLNISLSGPKSSKKKKKSATKVKLPSKKDIGSPCCFQHVTSVELEDKDKIFSLATLVDQ
ncbi:hypothetical protein LAZ67_15000114 [Cordylochernes scorpioides]|uniref:WH1 domain-containing protein n=1 Tax=Cordylochernes scorpioides TaxID=51811 RepID=A0ABY6LB99_9ARAC|nr:hypothetical protein LAZ67_15000112 [Cordylochernes scorpioides]UYV77204.1 hypothetical protein LAZ67_15000114 [Cordylochernes scorpioides]